MDRAELIDSVAEDLFAYVMHGTMPETHVAEQIKPNGLDERFEDFDALVDLHFILKPEVIDFVEALPHRIRSIKTQTKNVSTASRGEIDGRIDWESTMTTRASSAPGDRSLFVCDTRHESYDVDENVVLKRLLSLIYTTLDDAEYYLKQEYDWVTDRWQENLELVDRMRDLFERNVHVTRIRAPERYEPTDRMLQRADGARNEIYREAAALLRDHQASRRGDVDAIRTLLADTAITPGDEETLFELYVLFQYVNAIEDHKDGDATVSTIQTDRQEVARIESEDGSDVVLYHDNSGRDDISFITHPREKAESDLTRSERIYHETQKITNRYFKDSDFQVRSNRPDVIVLEIQRDDQYEYLVTEVKNSIGRRTIRNGITETLEYLAFLRRDDQLVYEEETPFGTGWNGVLVVQDMEEQDTASLHEQETIRILQASELDTAIPELLERVL
ncbi:hypothetical protein L593_06405 [Salinarchaeum sp. Harcht-Bsk1]|uniref:hypothetical protein n=1 Tax=Salinarchaeum sp. Harcht-Bsk1 TaxID=1333523 RepID=UPI0003422BEA|nr:hypothetical protein [Salinarchaeum sp. Harcht-Bsk1]AGN01228.1 hypothetical protein L593_06405 [Salinarchaeum sp. Harcht-Bsk1]